jgi:GGDEF domain-containing protein
MVERRVDFATRKRVTEMSPDEMRRALLVSEKTGLPNRRAFDEGDASPFVAMSDIDGLKMMNDTYGYAAGDMLIRTFAEVLLTVGLDAYHDKGDEFLCKGSSFQELNTKLSLAQHLMKRQKLVAESMSGRVAKIDGAEFCFGIGTNLAEAERSLKHQKELRSHRSGGSLGSVADGSNR